MFGKRAEQEKLAALRAEVQSLQARLSADVSTLDPGDDPVCRQALADASERQTAAGSVLSGATTVGELRVAQRIVVEGLTATRLVRQQRGLPLGPDLPQQRGLPLGPDLPDLAAPTVDRPTAVTMDGTQHVAHPDYHPERPHYFGGNAMAPAGYYRTPFWKKALGIGGAVLGAEMLGNALGDMFDGDRGFGDGGGWGDGGDGGGWGDGGGGGDWGGGGGDWGG